MCSNQTTATDFQTLMADISDPIQAAHCQRFFKTGPGEYGEGDLFRGVTVPELRKLARRWKSVPFNEMLLLLQSPYHEDRFVALCLLIHSFQHGHEDAVYSAYLDYLPFINNWDLVDISCHKVLGPYLFIRPRTLLYTLAQSRNVWERRIAMVTTYYFIKRDQLTDTLALADLLSNDHEDLIHKACGWMLREAGKRDESVLKAFLDDPSIVLPRTALRYAIERLPAPVRKEYLKQHPKISPPNHMPRWRAYQHIMTATETLKGNVVFTPIIECEKLSELHSGTVYLKLENQQHSGSFKYRGALNKLQSLEDLPHTVASTGNHGLATCMIAKDLHLDQTIYIPSTTDAYKVDKLKNHGADLIVHGKDATEAEQKAREIANQKGYAFISPYNDWKIIAGQGTIGIELFEQTGPLDYVFVSVGGGGLISGLSLALKAHMPNVIVIGCSPERSNVMQKSVEAGQIVEQPALSTLSDGTAGGIEEDAITLPLCMDLIDDWETATEDEIGRAMRLIYQQHHMKIEGAAAVAVACLMKYKKDLTGKIISVIICGGNISDERFENVLSDEALSTANGLNRVN